MNTNDTQLDNFYTSAFKATCYSKENIPKDYLPYGLITDNTKYTSKYTDLNKDDWTLEVYEDCLNYLKRDKNLKPEEWNSDFIVFTNLQIAFYNKCDLIRDNDEFEILVDYTAKQIRNLRSYVARNAHLFLECLIDCLDNEEMYNTLCNKIITHLLICSGSEKSIYRESSKNNLKNITDKCSKYFNQEIIWILLEQTNNKNKRISSTAGDCTVDYFLNSNKVDLELLDTPRFINYVESSLNARNIDVKKNIKKLVLKLPDILSNTKISEFIQESKNNKSITELIRKEYGPNLLK